LPGVDLGRRLEQRLVVKKLTRDAGNARVLELLGQAHQVLDCKQRIAAALQGEIAF